MVAGAACKGMGRAELRGLAIGVLVKAHKPDGAGQSEYQHTAAKEQQCATAVAGLIEEARRTSAAAGLLEGCAGVLGDAKLPDPVDVGGMGTTELLLYIKQHLPPGTHPPTTKAERLTVACAFAAEDASRPVVRVTATMDGLPGAAATFYHRECSREFVREHEQGSGQCEHCRKTLRKSLLGRLTTRMSEGAPDSKDQNRRLQQRGESTEKVRRLQKEKKGLTKKVSRLQQRVKRVEGALAAYQELDREPRTAKQNDIAHSIMQAANQAKDADGNNLLDACLKPGTMGRIVWDTNINNIASLIKTGGKQGCRYPAALHRLGLSLLLRCGKSAYDELQKHFASLPGLSQLEKYKNCVPQKETGVLHTVLQAMMHDVVLPGMRADETPAGGRGEARKAGGDRAKEPHRKHACKDDAWIRSVSVSFDEMTCHGRMSWNADHTRMIGMPDDDASLEVAIKEYEKEMEDLVASVSGEPAAASHRCEAPQLATKYLVFFATSLGANADDKHYTFPCARYALSEVNSGKVQRLLRGVLVGLANYGFVGVAVSADGAGENAGAQTALCTIPASRFYTAFEMHQLTQDHPDIDFTYKVAFPHPVFGPGTPVFWLSDMPVEAQSTSTEWGAAPF